MRTPAAAAPVALARTPYCKSSRSTGTGNCVMVGSASGWVGIQDSKEHPEGILTHANHDRDVFLIAIWEDLAALSAVYPSQIAIKVT